MGKTLKLLKYFAICAAIALALLPATINAQSEMFFHANYNDDYEKREVEELFGLYNEPFGTSLTPFGFTTFGLNTPLGSGLLIMVVAGAGYALARNKRTSRKAATILLLCTMTLSFTQCRKAINTETINGETVRISLNVGNGGRHIIEPGQDYVPIVYEEGDVIYVSNGGSYAGKLTCIADDDAFIGDITVNDPNDNLYFYFLGGLITKDLDANTKSLTVNICNQGDKLPVLSYGLAEYVAGQSYYYCQLSNRCALVQFDFAEATNKKVKISNMLCEAEIDFSEHKITPTERLDAITLYPKSNTEKWAVVLFSNVERKSMGMVYDKTLSYSSAISNEDVEIYDYYDGVTIPALSHENNFLYGASAISVNNAEANRNNGVFVVSANGNAVRFASGNLKCTKTGTNWTDGYEWSFMEHQYDVVETNSNSYCTDNYGNKDVVSLFGWGCTGIQDALYNGDQQYFMPYNTIWPSGNSTYVYGPTGNHNLSLKNNSDWGAVIPNVEGYNWRLLTSEEWNYLLKSRYNALGRQGGGRVMNNGKIVVNGAIILPEKASGNVISMQGNAPSWADNEFATLQDLEDFLNNNDAIFLPASGYREGRKVRSKDSNGRYWTSTHDDRNNDINYASYLTITSGSGFSLSCYWRAEGYSVRLVY